MSDHTKLESLIKNKLGGEFTSNWCIQSSKISGKGVFAQKSFDTGQIVFIDEPIILGPRIALQGSPVCVVCLKKSQLHPCKNGCKLPLCSVCQGSNEHSQECNLIQSWTPVDSPSWSIRLYQSLAPLRGLILSETDKQILLGLQANANGQESIEVKLIQSAVEAELNQDQLNWIDKCCCVLNSVGFEVYIGKDEPEVRGLYPLSGIMNHTCSPNTRHWFTTDRRMVVATTKPVNAGEELTTSYCPLLWPTTLRSHFLMNTKQFLCSCTRCLDPTEFGTFLSSLQCSCSGIVMPGNPRDIQSTWTCQQCGSETPATQAVRIQVTNLNGESSSKLALASTNHVILQNAILELSQLKLENLFELTEESLRAKNFQISRILNTIDKLQLGACRTKGLVLFAIFQVQAALLTKCYEANENSMKETLTETLNILADDPSAPAEFFQIISQLSQVLN